MSFTILWKPKPRKFLSKLQKNIALRILEKVDALQKDPFRYLEHYEGASVYKFRVGDYRLLIDVNFESRTLISYNASRNKNLSLKGVAQCVVFAKDQSCVVQYELFIVSNPRYSEK